MKENRRLDLLNQLEETAATVAPEHLEAECRSLCFQMLYGLVLDAPKTIHDLFSLSENATAEIFTASRHSENATAEIFTTSRHLENATAKIFTASRHSENATAEIFTTSRHSENTTVEIFTASRQTVTDPPNFRTAPFFRPWQAVYLLIQIQDVQPPTIL